MTIKRDNQTRANFKIRGDDNLSYKNQHKKSRSRYSGESDFTTKS